MSTLPFVVFVVFVVTITQDEDGMYVAECPSVPACVSQGTSAEEAEANLKEAIRECLKVPAEQGLPLIDRRDLITSWRRC